MLVIVLASAAVAVIVGVAVGMSARTHRASDYQALVALDGEDDDAEADLLGGPYGSFADERGDDDRV